MELTNLEIKRQDFVDNKIFDLICSLNPTEQIVDWNIEFIGEIRGIFLSWFEDRLNICNEKEFYPYIKC